jgi:hypothetical protein
MFDPLAMLALHFRDAAGRSRAEAARLRLEADLEDDAAAIDRDEKGGRPAKTRVGTDTSLTRTQAAKNAGLSPDQRKTALRLANIPEARNVIPLFDPLTMLALELRASAVRLRAEAAQLRAQADREDLERARGERPASTVARKGPRAQKPSASRARSSRSKAGTDSDTRLPSE